MKKTIFSLLYIIGLGLPLFTACNTDTSENPTLYEASSFVQDAPEDKLYDLGDAQDVVTLHCTQPEYGFTAATTYSVQVSLDETFTEESEPNYTVLSTTYNSTTIELKATELNKALVEMYKAAHPDEETTGLVIPAYFRLTAVITGSDRGAATSNVVKVNQIKLGEIKTTLEPPTEMFLVGSCIGNAWSTWKPMVSVNGMAGEFWSMVYFPANAEFKFGKFEQDWNGYGKVKAFNDKAGAGISGSDNIVVSKAGWYIVYILTEVNDDDYQYTMTFYKPNVYIFGSTNGNIWDYNDSWMFTVPEDQSGEFKSPALTAAGEVRMCIKADTDWWRLEFTLKNGSEIFYRENNAVNSGWTDLGPEYSIAGTPGQVISLNFTEGTGSVK